MNRTEARERKITYFEIEDGIEEKCCVRFLITALHTETLNNHEDYILQLYSGSSGKNLNMTSP
ncbi:hypothetical protein T09_10041 [Trichinella sp. T9]|uniref:Uncharacterized protein n=1 Tax=Trichinella murrelli TaxID=144512 RepID=A0A0V0STP8_9BILA|nr:hypothetical protein T05_8765 [Trichinella murrelli]KRX36453.1 hypothetical protein T09_10041 [Trichinella sp. T9]